MGNNLPSGPFEIMNMNINRIFRLLVLSCSLCPSALKAQDEMPRAAGTDMTVGMAEEPHVPKCLFVDPVVDPGDDPEEGRELNIENLLSVLEKYNVKFKKIVLAQALLETGYFSSRVCQVYNNLFGLRHPSDGKPIMLSIIGKRACGLIAMTCNINIKVEIIMPFSTV